MDHQVQATSFESGADLGDLVIHDASPCVSDPLAAIRTLTGRRDARRIDLVLSSVLSTSNNCWFPKSDLPA